MTSMLTLGMLTKADLDEIRAIVREELTGRRERRPRQGPPQEWTPELEAWLAEAARRMVLGDRARYVTVGEAGAAVGLVARRDGLAIARALGAGGWRRGARVRVGGCRGPKVTPYYPPMAQG